MKTLTLVLALTSLSAFASVDVVYKAETDMTVLRTELKMNKNGAAWIQLDLEDVAPEGGMNYQESKKISVDGLSYDVSNGEVLYKGVVCGIKRTAIGSVLLGSAKLSSNCTLSAAIVHKTSYVVDTEGNQQPINTKRLVEVKFGSK